MKYVTVIVLYVIFSVASALAGVWGVLSLVTGDTSRISRITHAMDRLLAAMLGWDGKSTVSRECGTDDCRFCTVLCRILDKLLEKHHCEKEAARRRV